FQDLRIDDVRDDGLVLAAQVLVQALDELLAGGLDLRGLFRWQGRSPLEALDGSREAIFGPFKVTSGAGRPLQQRNVLPVQGPGPDEVGMAQVQLARDAADLGLLDARDLAIRGGDREEAFQERR